MEPTTRMVLVPGYWLGAWAWDDVAARLRGDGHDVTALDHPGVGGDAGASVDELLAPLLALVADGPPPLLVVHSGAGAYASLVTDRAPDAVRRVVYVDSGPVADGQTPRPDLASDDELAPPDVDQLGAMGPMVSGLSAQQLGTFAERGLPMPRATVVEPVRLYDERRLAVPSTFVCCSFDGATVQAMAADGEPMFAPVADLTDTTFVDLPTGHWPMWSRPDDLARVLAHTV